MKTGRWTFDASVAERFDEIAHTNIPHYEAVIEQCVAIARDAFPDRASTSIIDIGSATGYTLQKLRDAGYEQVFGVDNSEAMLAHSRVRENLILSDVFPKREGPFHLALANWTLHFLREPEREQYLRDVIASLHPGGIFILSDKMEADDSVYEQYHDFKRRNGLSEAEIAEKAAAIQGVLTPLPLDWYQNTLQGVGFRSVDIADTAWCFTTLVCRR